MLGVDGSYLDVRTTFDISQKSITTQTAQQSQGQQANKVMRQYTIVGSTCMERDILFEKAILTEVETGDIILIGNVGAYCMF